MGLSCEDGGAVFDSNCCKPLLLTKFCIFAVEKQGLWA